MAAVSPASGRNYIPTLHGWRAVAILLVLYGHGKSIFLPDGPFPSDLLYRNAECGTAGVDIFFALSGFLITSLLLNERGKTGSVSLFGFYWKRMFRILPPYLVYLFVIGLLIKCGTFESAQRPYIASFVFLRNYLPYGWGADYVTAHFWSLSVEEHFYLLWPAVLLFVANRPKLAVVVPLLAIALCIWREIDLRYAVVDGMIGQPFATAVWRTDTQLGGLLLGAWAAITVRSNPSPWWASVTAWWIALLMFMLCAFPLRGLPGAYLGVSVTAMVLVVGTSLRPRSPISRALEIRPLVWLGLISYSLYIWQQLFLVVPGRGLPAGRLSQWPWNFPCAFAAACVSYYIVEQPVRQWGLRLLERRRTTQAVNA